MAATITHRTPDLLEVLRPATPEQPILGLDELELADTLSAILDRLDTAGPEEAARLHRVEGALERELGRLARQ